MELQVKVALVVVVFVVSQAARAKSLEFGAKLIPDKVDSDKTKDSRTSHSEIGNGNNDNNDDNTEKEVDNGQKIREIQYRIRPGLNARRNNTRRRLRWRKRVPSRIQDKPSSTPTSKLNENQFTTNYFPSTPSSLSEERLNERNSDQEAIKKEEISSNDAGNYKKNSREVLDRLNHGTQSQLSALHSLSLLSHTTGGENSESKHPGGANNDPPSNTKHPRRESTLKTNENLIRNLPSLRSFQNAVTDLFLSPPITPSTSNRGDKSTPATQDQPPTHSIPREKVIENAETLIETSLFETTHSPFSNHRLFKPPKEAIKPLNLTADGLGREKGKFSKPFTLPQPPTTERTVNIQKRANIEESSFSVNEPRSKENDKILRPATPDYHFQWEYIHNHKGSVGAFRNYSHDPIHHHIFASTQEIINKQSKEAKGETKEDARKETKSEKDQEETSSGSSFSYVRIERFPGAFNSGLEKENEKREKRERSQGNNPTQPSFQTLQTLPNPSKPFRTSFQAFQNPSKIPTTSPNPSKPFRTSFQAFQNPSKILTTSPNPSKPFRTSFQAFQNPSRIPTTSPNPFKTSQNPSKPLHALLNPSKLPSTSPNPSKPSITSFQPFQNPSKIPTTSPNPFKPSQTSPNPSKLPSTSPNPSKPSRTSFQAFQNPSKLRTTSSNPSKPLHALLNPSKPSKTSSNPSKPLQTVPSSSKLTPVASKTSSEPSRTSSQPSRTSSPSSRSSRTQIKIPRSRTSFERLKVQELDTRARPDLPLEAILKELEEGGRGGGIREEGRRGRVGGEGGGREGRRGRFHPGRGGGRGNKEEGNTVFSPSFQKFLNEHGMKDFKLPHSFSSASASSSKVKATHVTPDPSKPLKSDSKSINRPSGFSANSNDKPPSSANQSTPRHISAHKRPLQPDLTSELSTNQEVFQTSPKPSDVIGQNEVPKFLSPPDPPLLPPPFSFPSNPPLPPPPPPFTSLSSKPLPPPPIRSSLTPPPKPINAIPVPESQNPSKPHQNSPTQLNTSPEPPVPLEPLRLPRGSSPTIVKLEPDLIIDQKFPGISHSPLRQESFSPPQEHPRVKPHGSRGIRPQTPATPTRDPERKPRIQSTLQFTRVKPQVSGFRNTRNLHKDRPSVDTNAFPPRPTPSGEPQGFPPTRNTLHTNPQAFNPPQKSPKPGNINSNLHVTPNLQPQEHIPFKEFPAPQFTPPGVFSPQGLGGTFPVVPPVKDTQGKRPSAGGRENINGGANAVRPIRQNLFTSFPTEQQRAPRIIPRPHAPPNNPHAQELHQEPFRTSFKSTQPQHQFPRTPKHNFPAGQKHPRTKPNLKPKLNPNKPLRTSQTIRTKPQTSHGQPRPTRTPGPIHFSSKPHQNILEPDFLSLLKAPSPEPGPPNHGPKGEGFGKGMSQPLPGAYEVKLAESHARFLKNMEYGVNGEPLDVWVPIIRRRGV